jgi:hypothetical protein
MLVGMTGDIPERVARRAATRFVVSGECHISTYSIASHGYAQIGWQDETGKMEGTTAHRAAWVHFTGEQIEPGYTVDHRQGLGCKSRRCVRREHLRSLINLENARRTSGRDWPVGTCRHGHGPEHWKPKSEKRQKGYCAMCRKIRRDTNIRTL